MTQPPASSSAPPLPGTVETWLSRLLKTGVLLSAAILSLGAALYLWREGVGAVQMSEYRPQPVPLTRPVSILRDAAALDPKALMQLGILVLVLTPVARVALALVLFALGRDRTYAAISLIVLIVLLLGLAGVV